MLGVAVVLVYRTTGRDGEPISLRYGGFNWGAKEIFYWARPQESLYYYYFVYVEFKFSPERVFVPTAGHTRLHVTNAHPYAGHRVKISEFSTRLTMTKQNSLYPQLIHSNASTATIFFKIWYKYTYLYMYE
jgi:hypothetical protein